MASSGGQYALQDVLMAGRNVEKSSYSRSIAGIKTSHYVSMAAIWHDETYQYAPRAGRERE